jgi:hypothetical protein
MADSTCSRGKPAGPLYRVGTLVSSINLNRPDWKTNTNLNDSPLNNASNGFIYLLVNRGVRIDSKDAVLKVGSTTYSPNDGTGWMDRFDEYRRLAIKGFYWQDSSSNWDNGAARLTLYVYKVPASQIRSTGDDVGLEKQVRDTLVSRSSPQYTLSLDFAKPTVWRQRNPAIEGPSTNPAYDATTLPTVLQGTPLEGYNIVSQGVNQNYWRINLNQSMAALTAALNAADIAIGSNKELVYILEAPDAPDPQQRILKVGQIQSGTKPLYWRVRGSGTPSYANMAISRYHVYIHVFVRDAVPARSQGTNLNDLETNLRKKLYSVDDQTIRYFMPEEGSKDLNRFINDKLKIRWDERASQTLN